MVPTSIIFLNIFRTLKAALEQLLTYTTKKESKMKSLLTLTFLFNFILLYGHKPPQKQAIVLDQPLNTDNSLFWQISGKDLQKPSYLYGTIHIISQDDFFIGKNVQKKLQKSNLLIMEMDLKNMDVAALASVSVLNEGKTIKDYMSDTDYAHLRTFMEKFIGVKPFTFESFYSRLKPLYIEQLIFFQHLGQEKESYEQHFKTLAEQKKIPIAGLETMEEQLKFMDEIPLDAQLKSIVKTIDNYSEETKKLDTLLQHYKEQNLRELTKYFEAEEDSSLMDMMVNKRNDNWIPKLKAFMQDKSCFIAVGAGHLGGKNGLINLFKEQGYTVEPISIN